MPDLSDKVSDIAPCPFDHEQRVLGLSIVPIAELNAPRWYVRCMDCGAHGPRTGTRNSALSAWNARTRPPGSSMGGWRTMDSAPENEWLDVWSENFGLARAHLSGQWGYAWMERPEVAVPGPPTYWRPLAASPIPPEVMK